MKYLGIAIAFMLALAVPVAADVQGPTGTSESSVSENDTFQVQFSANGGGSGNCMQADSVAGTATLTACTSDAAGNAQLDQNAYLITAPAGVAPDITSISCWNLAAVPLLDDGESITYTPVWVDFDEAGTVSQSDAATTVTFVDDADDDIGDIDTNTTTSTSPYTGSQGLRIRVTLVGNGFTQHACSVLLTL